MVSRVTELEQRLAEVESILEAIRSQEVDAVIGYQDIMLLKLRKAEEKLQYNARQQELVATLGVLALRERNLQKLFDFTTTQLKKTLGISHTQILQQQNMSGSKKLHMLSGAGWNTATENTESSGLTISSQAKFTLKSGLPVLTDDVRTEHRFTDDELCNRYGIISGITCIIPSTDTNSWGVLAVYNDQPSSFTDNELNFLVSIANILCDSIRQNREEQVLRDIDKRKDEFLDTLAHELRNPLAPLQSGLDILSLSSLGPEETQKIVHMMSQQIRHLVRLIDDLLDISRITRGKIILDKKPIDLKEVIQESIQLSDLSNGHLQRNVTVTLPDEPLIIYADPVRINQIMINLISNAVKYTDNHGCIDIKATRDEGMVTVEVKDDGIGLAPDILNSIFDMYFQVDPKRCGAMGIGLTLVRSLVKMHDGSISAYSSGNNRGSEFVVSLPLTDQPKTRIKFSNSDQQNSLAGQRLLVIDDYKIAADSLGKLLETLNAEICVVYDGASAIQKLQTFKPTAILSDIGMPEMDGYELAKRIHSLQLDPQPTLIALTGWGQDQHKIKIKQAGYDHHMVKPVDITQLLKLLVH
jgi:signal transduction histidine kinase